jgi:Txe/YoeB family toxin of Txe-Axe toxin-antitoxin module
LQDTKLYKKILTLIKDIKRDPYIGIGKPEPLKYDMAETANTRKQHHCFHNEMKNAHKWKAVPKTTAENISKSYGLFL